jgi:hypothetical protein
VTTFLELWRGRVRSLATFGDSLTQALSIADPSLRWANRLAEALGASTLYNRGLSGTVLQSSPAAGGLPRADNGRSRYAHDLLGPERGDVVAILYSAICPMPASPSARRMALPARRASLTSVTPAR